MKWHRLAACVVGLVCLAARADDQEEERSLDGLGRLSVLAGYRWAPNEYFYSQAGSLGNPVTRKSRGGPQAAFSFGYGATSFVEGSVDLFFGYETFHLQGLETFNSFSYGALFGARFCKMDWPVHGLAPHVGFQAGPVLGIVNSNTYKNRETLGTGYSFDAGLSLRLNDRFGFTFDARYLVARSYVSGISGVNVGGVFVSLGFNVYFAGQSNRSPTSDLITPPE